MKNHLWYSKHLIWTPQSAIWRWPWRAEPISFSTFTPQYANRRLKRRFIHLQTIINSEVFPIQGIVKRACSTRTASSLRARGWRDLSSGLRVFFLRVPCGSGAVMQLPLWEGEILTTRFLWTECLRKPMIIPNEVTSIVKGIMTE